MYLIITIKEKETVLLLIPNDISIEEKLYKKMNVKVSFYDKQMSISTRRTAKCRPSQKKADGCVLEKLLKINNIVMMMDFTISKNHALINKAKDNYIEKILKDH